MYIETRSLAERVVNGLKDELDLLHPQDLPGIRSIFVTGSYVRGDWLDCSSDLDITLLLRSDAENGLPFQEDFRTIQTMAQRISKEAEFPSQCPGGMDWSIQPSIPTTREEAYVVGPYLYYSIFLFDLKEHLLPLWGEHVQHVLPSPPNPAELALAAVDMLLARLSHLGNAQEDARKAAFAAYKATLIAQLAFGERTLNKYRVLELYNKHVPAFPSKYIGQRIIRDYIGSYFPDKPAKLENASYYTHFVRDLRVVVAMRGCSGK
jgi:hypothetical protein